MRFDNRTAFLTWAALWAGLLLLTFWPILDSRYFVACINSHGTSIGEQYKPSEQYAAPVAVTGIALGKRCLGGFVYHFNAVITALATVLIGIVTAGLVWMSYLQITTTRAQLRAYVFPHSATLYDGTTAVPPSPAHAGIPSVSMSFKNSGGSPAFGVQSRVAIKVIEEVNESILVAPPLPRGENNALGVDAEMPKWCVFERALTASEIADIAAGVKRIYIYGWIEYDSLRRRRRTEFRLFYQGVYPPPLNHNLVFSEKGNKAT